MRYLSDADLFQRLMGQAITLQSWQVQNPLFGTSRRYFDWLEFLVKGFWDYLVEMARLSGDTTIYFCDLEQAKISVFSERFGLYPLVQLDIGMTEPEYVAALNQEPGAVQRETFAVSNTNAYLIFPPSGRWHVRGEYSIEMAELASTVGLPDDAMFPHDFWTEIEALHRVESVK